MTSSARLEQFCDDWYSALNSRSTDAMLDLTTPDVLWDDTVFWPAALRGQDELRTYLDRVWQTMPNYEFYEVKRFFAPDLTSAVVLWGQRGSGPSHLAPDATFDFQGCDVFLEFHEGRLAHYQAAYEITDMCRQLGLLPPREGRLGAAYLMSLARSSTSG
jgi:hypothetical protein